MGFNIGIGTPMGTPRYASATYHAGSTPMTTPRGGGGAAMVQTPRSVSGAMTMLTPRVNAAVTSGASVFQQIVLHPTCLLHRLPICSSSGFNVYPRSKSLLPEKVKEEKKPKEKKKKLTLKSLVKLTMMFRPEIRLYFRMNGYDAGPLFQGRVSAREGELRTVGDILRVLRQKLTRNVQAYVEKLKELFPYESSAGRTTIGMYSAKAEDIIDEDADITFVEDDDTPPNTAGAMNNANKQDDGQDKDHITVDHIGGVYTPTIKLFYMVSPNDIAHFDLYAFIPQRGRPVQKLLLQQLTYYPWNKQIKRFGCDMLPHPPGSRKILFETPKPQKKNIVVKFHVESDWQELQQLMRFLFDDKVKKHQQELKETQKTFAETYFKTKLEREAGVTKELMLLSEKLLEKNCGNVQLGFGDSVKTDMNENMRKMFDLYIKSKQEMLWDVSLKA